MARIFYLIPLLLVANCAHFNSAKSWPLTSLNMPQMQQLIMVTLTSKEKSKKNGTSTYQWVVDSQANDWTLVVLSATQRRLGSFSLEKGSETIQSHWPLSDSDIRQMAIIFQQAVGNIDHSPASLNDVVIEQKENVRTIYQRGQLVTKIVYTSDAFKKIHIKVDSSKELAEWSMVTDSREMP